MKNPTEGTGTDPFAPCRTIRKALVSKGFLLLFFDAVHVTDFISIRQERIFIKNDTKGHHTAKYGPSENRGIPSELRTSPGPWPPSPHGESET
jgi:hypothetical protein